MAVAQATVAGTEQQGDRRRSMAMWLSRLWRKFAAPMKPKKGGMTPSGKEVDYEKMRDYIGYEFLLRCSSNFEEACLVVRRCLHHGLLGMIFIIILTFVSYLGKLRYFIADEYKTSLCKWLLGRDEDGTGVTTVSIVNYLNDKYDLSKQTEENFPDVNKHNIATNAQVLILASKLAYEDMQKWRFVVSELWKMEWVAGYSFQPQGTQVFIFKHKSALVVALRGTEPFNIWDWLVDLDARMIRATDGVTSNPGRERLGYMHFGFFSALMQPESPSKYKVIRADGNHQPMASSESAETLRPYDILRKHVLDELRGDRNLRLFVTGHSLGGALACVFSAHLFADIDTDHVIKPQFKLLCTFGQPRTGGTKFALYMDHLIHGPGRTGEHDNEEFRYLRFVNNNDIVPRIPPPVRYSHSTQFVFLNEFGYEEIDTEMNGLEIFRVIVGEVASFFRRSTEFITNLPMDLVNRDWRRPLLRLMVIIIPSLIYDHFPHEYERVVRRRPDPYFDEDYWGTKQERSGIVQ